MRSLVMFVMAREFLFAVIIVRMHITLPVCNLLWCNDHSITGSVLLVSKILKASINQISSCGVRNIKTLSFLSTHCSRVPHLLL